MSRRRFRKLLPLVSTLALILPLLLALASPVSAATLCVKPGGPGACYASIQAAVNAAGAGDVIKVFPGTYNESVDLGGHSGGLTLRTVNAAGNPTPHTATVNGGTTGPAFNTSSTHSGNITIDGFAVQTAKGSGAGYDYDSIHLDVNSNVIIRNVTASGGDDGIEVDQASGNVTVEDSQANSNDSDGFVLDDVGGNLTVTRCTANDNDDENFDIGDIGGNVTITNSTANRSDDEEGFDLNNIDGNVTLTGCTANDNEDENFEIDEVDGNVTLTGCTANGSKTDEGIRIGQGEGGGIGGDVKITDCTANGNDEDGIRVECVGGECENGESSRGADEESEVEEQDLDDDDDRLENAGASVRPSANGGNVTISNCTTNGNGVVDGDDGIYVREIAGNLEISNCTAIGNGQDGFDPEDVEGDVTITDSVVRLTADQEGVDLDQLDDDDPILVNGSIICENNDGLESDETTDAEANWWGCTAGPGNAGCDTVIGGAVDYTPWIDTVTASAPASAMAGQPTVVSFQFSGGPPAVYLGEGPGDLHGDPTFIVTTDNGTVTGGFINAPNGVLEVTLVPAHGGTATVWVHGPCGLDDSVVLGVEAEFVPEPGSVMLLASGLMGLAGYAGLRMRRK